VNNQITDEWALLEADNPRIQSARPPTTEAWPVWNYDEGRTIRVVCYTNTAKVRLELNGKEVGTTKDYDTRTGIIYWDIPFQAGKLEVIGMDTDKNEVASYAIHSSKRPEKLTLVSSEKQICKNKGVAQLIVRIEDEDGIPVALADNEITCQIIGPGRLLGLEAGNSQDMGDYTDNRHNAFRGYLLAYIQATGEEGKIRIRFSSPWLKPVETTIQAH
jgi:hypothetical protein